MTDQRQPVSGSTDQASPAVRRKRNFAVVAAQRDAYAAMFGIDSAAILKRKAAAGLPPVPPTPTAAKPPATTLRPKWSDGVAVKKMLKGDASYGKVVSLVNVGGQDLVLKAAPRLGNDPDDPAHRSTTEDNAEAAQLIRRLNLKGVRAPEIRIVKGREKDDMIAALQTLADGGGAGSLEASNMIGALKAGDVQLSSMDQGGVNLDHVFQKNKEIAAAKGSLAIRRSGAGDPEKTWAEALAAAVQSWSYIGKNNDLGSSDPATRRRGVMTEIAKNPPDWAKSYLSILMDILDGRQAEGLKKAEDEAVEHQANQNKLRDFTKSPEGMEAYAGIAVADLVTGMYDRMAEEWNGGNFLFDPGANEFCCVDNNKKPSQGLTEADPAEWTNFFTKAAASSSGSLSDAMFDKVYGSSANDAPDRPANMPGLTLSDEDKANGRAIFADVLQNVMTTIESDPDASPAAKKRVAVMKDFMAVHEILIVPTALLCPGATPEPTTGGKVIRGLKSFGSDWFGDADKIKSDLRANPAAFQRTRAALDALIARHPKDSKGGNDRLAVHIRFLATACEFGQLLGERANALGTVGNTPFSKAAQNEQHFDSIAAHFPNQAEFWKNNLKGSDAAIVTAISTGQATYKAACDTFKAKALA